MMKYRRINIEKLCLNPVNRTPSWTIIFTKRLGKIVWTVSTVCFKETNQNLYSREQVEYTIRRYQSLL